MQAVEFEVDIEDQRILIPLEKTPPSKHVRVILLSSGSEPQKRRDGLDFSDYDVRCFLGHDPLKIQKDLRDEWS